MDWSIIDWPLVATHGLLVFLSALIANLFVVLIGDNRVVAALFGWACLFRSFYRLDVLPTRSSRAARDPPLITQARKSPLRDGAVRQDYAPPLLCSDGAIIIDNLPS